MWEKLFATYTHLISIEIVILCSKTRGLDDLKESKNNYK